MSSTDATADAKASKPKTKKPKDDKPISPTSTAFPLARVQRIIKTDEDVNKITSEAVFLIAKSTEFFLENFVTESYKSTKRDKRRTIQYKDLAKAVQDIDSLEFLTDIVPEKITLGKNV